VEQGALAAESEKHEGQNFHEETLAFTNLPDPNALVYTFNFESPERLKEKLEIPSECSPISHTGKDREPVCRRFRKLKRSRASFNSVCNLKEGRASDIDVYYCRFGFSPFAMPMEPFESFNVRSAP
jgi:hypothetical protein